MAEANRGETVRHLIDYPLGSGRRRGFLKIVHDVDLDLTTGWAFIGEFLDDGRQNDIPLGALVVRKRPTGSIKSQRSMWSYAIVTASETPSGWEWSDEYQGNREFLNFRDLVARRLNEDKSDLERMERALKLTGITASADQIRVLQHLLERR